MFKFYKSFLIFFSLSCYSSYVDAVINAYITSAARTEQSTSTTPASITVISQQDIQSSGASHIVDVLRGFGGVYVEDSFGDGSRAVVSMRGFSSSVANANTLILVDGRRLNNTDISGPDLNSISLKDVERIEIVQGSAGVLYGDQAVGGVINIITSTSSKKVGLLEASVGTYDTAGLRAVYGDKVTEDLHYKVSAEVRQSDNYRRDNNKIEYANLAAKSGYDYSNGNVFAELQFVKEDLQLPGSLLQSELNADRRQTFVDFLNDFTNSETDVFRIGAVHSLSDDWSFEGEATYRDVEREIQQSFRGFVISAPSSLKRKQTELLPRLIGTIPVEGGNVQITAGVDLIDTDFNSEITFSEDEQRLLSEYVQVVFPVNENLNVTSGFRHAEVEDDVVSGFVNGKQKSDVNVGELGVSYNISDGFKFFGRVSQNFRFAKVDELTYVSPGTQLKPQTGDSYEAGMQYRNEASFYKLVVYELTLEDEIAFDSTAIQPVGTFFPGANVNFDPTTHRGVIIETSYDIASDIDVSGGYTYSDAMFDSGVFAGNSISGVAENSGRLNVNYQLNDLVDVNFSAVYVGSKYLDGDNANLQGKVSGYTVLNTNLLYAGNDWNINLKINNITNRKYFENANSFGSRYPLPERNLLMTAGWKFR